MTNHSEEKKLRDLLKARTLEPFIEHIRFPHFKNLEPNTQINFTYPITALVGANGTNKSSALRALYGSPENNNLGIYWFSTSIDPIKESTEGRNCFIYGYWNKIENKTIEVLKTRIDKVGDPDYWEPSRPLAEYGMEKIPEIKDGLPTPTGRSKTRWNAIEKSVSYLDFRADLSAYDKFFYNGELLYKQITQKNKKSFLRIRSYHLKYAIQNKLKTYLYQRNERIINKENRILSDNELSEISTIIGKNYSEISLIRHFFFNCDAYTAIMKISDLNYSEAFAGSGEFAVVRLVVDIMKAPDHSLILLDEPEVSLHPGAQEKLMSFLAKMVKEKKHQIVISTHSPAIIRRLPTDAIKVFVMNKNGKVIIPSQEALPEEAFYHLGEPIPGKITIVVEDVLGKEIVLRALRLTGDAKSKMFDVRYYHGGAQTIIGHFIPQYSTEQRADILVLLDGDQKFKSDIPESTTLPEAEDLKQRILDITGEDVQFYTDGGDIGTKVKQINQLRRQYIDWIRINVDFLPSNDIPEVFIWENMKKDDISKDIKAKNAKDKFNELTKKELGLSEDEKVKSEDILATQRRKLATITDTNIELINLKNRLLQQLHRRN